MKKKDKKYPAYTTDFFPVSDGHRLYYELYGNPKGIPVLFLHGGPGGGIDESDKRFFDSKRFQVILFDQRGSGKSTPFATTKANTTQHLVEDIQKLLKHLGIKKVMLFGGSWGSTLALVFAIHHPEMVSSMVVRGIFLATKLDMQHYIGGGVRNFFPEIWEDFIGLVPKEKRNDIPAYYLSQMQSKDKKIAEKYAFAWAYYETAMLHLKTSDKRIRKGLKKYPYVALSILEAYYIKNHCFLPENYILENTKRIVHIPTSIIHGRFDFICPPINAYLLHKKMPGSVLHFVAAAHSGSEKEIEKMLVSETNRLADELEK